MKTNSKVALFTNFIPPYYRRVFEHLQGMLQDLRIFVSTPMEPNRNWDPGWAELPVTVQKCWTYTGVWRHEQGFSDKIWLHFPYDTLARLFGERPQIVISIQLGLRTLQAGIYRVLMPKTRLIIWTGLSEHTEKGLPPWRVFERKMLLRVADAVLVNGKSGVNYLRGLGVPSDKIFLEPYCAEISSLLELPLERDKDQTRRLLYIGQLSTRKGILPFVKSLSRWLSEHPETNCELWIAGDGPLRSTLENTPVSPRLTLRLLGNVAYENLPKLYAQCGILVFPTLADEWGVVVNEALAAGVPVLGSVYSQAVEELVSDGLDGWTFRPDHPDEVNFGLDRMMSVDGHHLAQMRSKCRARIRPLTPEYGAKCFLEAIKFVRPSMEQGASPGDPLESDSGTVSKLEAPTS